MRAPFGRLVLTLLASGLAACSSIYVERDWDPAASFAGWHTFAWREPPQGGAPTRLANPVLDRAIRETVVATLGARGFAETASAPDFLISGVGLLEAKEDVAFVDESLGYHTGAGPWAGPGTWTTTYEQGTLVLQVADGRTGAPVWRGTADAIVDRTQTPESRRARLREAVEEILSEFPPQGR